MWIDGVRPNLARLAETFDPARMDILLLMAPTTSSIGYNGRGDYAMLPDGALRKRREHQVVPFVYAGAAILSPSLFADAPSGEFSLTKMFDRANEQERLFGLRLDGVWMHVGTPDAVHAAERGVSRKRRLSAAATTLRSAIAHAMMQPDSRIRKPMRVFSVPVSAPFLRTVIAALVDGRLVDGFEARTHPEKLAQATLYLPTRRAGRMAREIFLDEFNTDAVLLPRIVALGDIDEDELAFAQAASKSGLSTLEVPPAMEGLQRRLLLAQLIAAWARQCRLGLR